MWGGAPSKRKLIVLALERCRSDPNPVQEGVCGREPPVGSEAEPQLHSCGEATRGFGRSPNRHGPTWPTPLVTQLGE